MFGACLLPAASPTLAQAKAEATAEPSARAAAVPLLRQIVAIADVSDLVAAPPPAVGVNIGRLAIANGSDLEAALAALLNRPIEPALLDEIRAAITGAYVAAGRPYLDVGFPQQDVTDGVLQVVVSEFRVGRVTVEGNAWFSESQIRWRTGLQPGQPIDKTALDLRLSQINGPFITVTPEFEAGQAPGTTDVVLRTEDRFPVRLTAGYDNSGNASTGFDRWQLGATWGNALWLGQVLSYQFTSSANFYVQHGSSGSQTDGPSYQAHSGSWLIPLPWGHTLTFAGLYSRSVPNIGPDLTSVGLNENGGVQYAIPAPGLVVAGHALGGTQQFTGGYDFKRTNNNLAFGGTTVSTGFWDVSQFFLRYDATVPDALGQTSLQNTLVASPGGMTPYNNNISFALSGTPGALANYVYDRLMLTRLIPLPRDFGLMLRATAQAATRQLLPSEQLSIAGIDAVRGYQEGSITVSTGFQTTVELSSPVFSPSFGLLGPGFSDTAQVHAFWDYGQGYNRASVPNSQAKLSTASIGIGGHYYVGDNLTFRVEEGLRLKSVPHQGANGAFALVSLQVAW